MTRNRRSLQHAKRRSFVKPQRPAAPPPPPQRRQPRRTAAGSFPRRTVLVLFLLLIIAVLSLSIARGNMKRLARQREEAAAEYERLVSRHTVMYRDWIEKYAAENGIEPAYVAAVILRESSYNADATSSVGARGLMQVMEDTFQFVRRSLNENTEFRDMYDPEMNIRYGCWFLGWLMKRYNGDMTCASSAYHQGHGTVDKWLANPEYSPDGATLTVIPSNATDTYIKRILKYYERYTELYAA